MRLQLRELRKLALQESRYDEKIPIILSDQIIEVYNHNDSLLQKMENTNTNFLEQLAENEVSKQPHLMSYILEVLFEISESEENIELSDEEMVFIYLMLKTEIDLLDHATT